jgi:nicotinamidase-related amidase
MQEFRENNNEIIHIRHIATRPGATFFLPGTEGAEINKLVSPLENELVIEKHFPNSFRETSLLKVLKEKEIDELIICGAMSHMCIDATTRAAFDFGFKCTVIKDACATRNLIIDNETVEANKVHNAFMAALKGTYAEVKNTSAAL